MNPNTLQSFAGNMNYDQFLLKVQQAQAANRLASTARIKRLEELRRELTPKLVGISTARVSS